MNKENIIDLLKDHNSVEVQTYLSYIEELQKDKKSKEWSSKISDDDIVKMFKKVANTGLFLDGKHITLQFSYGKINISWDYIALKNLMYKIYPETLIDLQLVFKGDEISFGKESGKIAYTHKLANPFEVKESDIIGGYCIIKNKRGEFLTTLNNDDIEKSRKKAKGDFIWKDWLKEMTLKTIIKKAVKIHFDDVFSEAIEMDNEENDLDNPIDIELSWKQEIDSIDNIEDLKKYYLENKGKGTSFDKYVTKKKSILEDNQKKENES